jgi:tartrate/fumarate subfamily iron-sulfur-dependent hydro-lyase beta chain
MVKNITLPISNETIRELNVGDSVLISGVMLTGRDAVHKWLTDKFIYKKVPPTTKELDVYQTIKPILDGGIIYHCGPVVSGLDTRQYKFVAAGPTTSIREEPYQGDVMNHFNIKGVIGKGGMGPKTLAACQSVPGVYFHAIGGVAALIANCVQKVLAVHSQRLSQWMLTATVCMKSSGQNPERYWNICCNKTPVNLSCLFPGTYSGSCMTA